MSKLAKFWGIAAMAALALLAYVFFRPAPLVSVPTDAQTEAISDVESDITVLANDALPTPNNGAETELAVDAVVADAANTDEGQQIAPAPLTDAAATNARPSPGAQSGQEVAIVAEISEARAEGVPEVFSGLETALQAPNTENDFGQRPQPDSNVTKAATPQADPAPDPVLPAPVLGGVPALGAAPEIASEASGAPVEERAAQLGGSSLPLTLAQVLPPGEAPAPDQIAPSFDLVRVAPDGSAVIAGRAAPGANVQVFSGTIPVAEAIASARGEFVIFLDAPSETTLDMQIPAAPEGAALIVSQEDIIILPAAPDAADATPIVVRRTPDAVQILQPSGPAIPSNVSLDLVSYADSGAVQLAGRGQPGNVARIYADGRLAGEAPITQGGNWALEISDIAEGRYVLRVDEISPAGEVLSRTESPFQRQFPEANMPESFSQGAKIIVQPGNTLWLMATEAYGDGDAYSQIFSANRDAIRDPDLIYPGQIFSIPRVEE